MEHKFTNRLIDATSPYLLQHAHNPVNWNPWGPEALRLAAGENKPIFLSIGYAACHWCHVMEHESFEDEEVARFLNEHFIPIKVDREERPDLDEIYMNATVLYTRGHGGWPMSVWLTPDGKPFFAGTYFPREDYYGRPGFKSVLERLAGLWREKAGDLLNDATQVVGILGNFHKTAKGEMLSRKAVSEAARQMLHAYDPRHGGVGSGTNKFPPSMSMELLLREHRNGGGPEMLEAVELTLEKMASGGIYDHLGGGIHRYSTDPQWLVPHFEKMLYDQALVSAIYLDGYLASGKKLFAEAARGIFEYVTSYLQSEEGGIYSTEDADSEGMEGKFYIWTLEQVQEALGKEEVRLFASYYDVTEQGNWDHPGDAHVPSGPKNILRILQPLEAVARQHSIDPQELRKRLAAARSKLFEVRQKRVRPGLDDKILAAWNGLMIASLVKGAAVLEEPNYLDAATRAADFVLARMQKDGRLLRSYRGGVANLTAYIDDYAFFIDGLTGLFEATGDLRWLAEAERLTDTAIEHYWDREQGGFFFTAGDHEKLIVRSKLANDNAIPSGNSVMVSNLLRLHLLLGRNDLRDKAAEILSLFSASVAQSSFGHERLLCGMEAFHEGFREIAIVGESQDPKIQALLRTISGTFLPNKVVALLDPGAPDAPERIARIPLLTDKQLLDGKPAAYVCRNYACQMPTSDPQALARQLATAS